MIQWTFFISTTLYLENVPTSNRIKLYKFLFKRKATSIEALSENLRHINLCDFDILSTLSNCVIKQPESCKSAALKGF